MLQPRVHKQKEKEAHKGWVEPQELQPQGQRKPMSFFVPSDLVDEGILQKLRPCVVFLNKYTPGRETERKYRGKGGLIHIQQNGSHCYAFFQVSSKNIPYSLLLTRN